MEAQYVSTSRLADHAAESASSDVDPQRWVLVLVKRAERRAPVTIPSDQLESFPGVITGWYWELISLETRSWIFGRSPSVLC